MDNVNRTLTHRQRQALETRRIITGSARDLFLENGYGATTIEAISDRAGVAVSTVYSIYKNKRGILKAIREEWHLQSGQREIYKQAIEASDVEEKLKIAAHATRRQWETSWSMIKIYQGAATTDSGAAEELQEAQEGRREGIRKFVHAITAHLRPDIDVERALSIYLALTRSELYQELVEISNWSADDYEAWLAETLIQQLL